MNAPASLICVNPVGESKNAPQYPPETWPLDTPGGRYYAEWDDQSHAPSRVGWGALAASMVVWSLRAEFTVRASL